MFFLPANFLLASAIAGYCHCLTVRLSGSGTSAVLGQTFRFTCTVTNDDNPTGGTVSFGRVGQAPVSAFPTSCSGGSSESGYSPSCGSSGVFYLDISSVRVRDNAAWGCSRLRQNSNNITLPVYYGPGQVTLDKSSQQTVPKSSTLTVVCSTSCNPCSYTWKKGTQKVSITRTLSLTNINRNQAGDYICTATNTQTGSTPRSTTLTVIVQYPPEVSLDTSPGSSSCRPYRVYVDQQNVQLTCQVTSASPDIATSFIWTHNDSPIPSATSSVYSLSHVNKSSGGSYTCAGRNPAGTSSNPPSLQVDVQYSPSVSVDSSKTAIEGQTLTVTCSVDSNPTASVTWTRKGGGSLPPQTGSTLTITNIQRSQTGTYVCTATNTLSPCGLSPIQRTDTDEVTVDVQYKPTISGIESSYPVTESSPLQINCSRYTTPGNPSTTSYRWTGPGSYTSSGPVLSISSISRTQTGQYTCTATNTLTPTGGPPQQGTATGQFHVDVQYPAVITSFTINSNTNTVTVNESDPVTMGCQVDSNPTSTIRLYNGSRELWKEENSLTHERRWTADCRQRGNYSCTAGNNIGSSGTVTRLIQLVVTCSPRQDETYPVEPIYASSIGSDISLSVTFLSYPTPIIVWRKTNGSSHRNLTSIANERVNSDISVTASLTLNGLNEEDFGEYLVQADNGMGQSAEYTLKLDPKGPPIPPSNLTILSQSSNTLEVAWKQGFNGGSEQTFTVEYSTDDLSWNKAGSLKETGSGQYLQMDITGLSPQTVYFVRVAASNEHGTTNTDSVRALTENVTGQSGALIGGVIAGVVIFLIVIVVVVIVVRRKRNTGDDTEKITKMKNMKSREEKLVMEENVCYDFSGEVAKPSSSAAPAAGASDVYAVVEKKNHNDVYAEVKKEKKVNGNGAAKGKKQEKHNGKGAKKDKAKKGKAKDDKNQATRKRGKGEEYENTAIGDEGNPYINHAFDQSEGAGGETAVGAGPKAGRDDDGCFYVGIDFGGQKPSTSVHKEEESTEYAAIKIGEVGPPMKDDKNETTTS